MNKASNERSEPPSAPPRVLVTGAGRGIGRGIALRLARDGFDVTINYRASAESARALADQIASAGGRASLLAFDVADRAGTAAALEADVKAHGAYWGLVLNAGIAADGLMATMKPEDWDRVLGTNLDSFYNVVRPLIMPMVRLRSGGRVVAVTSVSGVAGNPGQVNYSAAKAGLIGATKALALELASRGITVNAVAPGFIDTDMTAELPRDKIVAEIPMGRMGTADEIAGAVAYLMSPSAGYTTGQVLVVAGGLIT
jgi:3-oxoacyl-[acyl-carrier protein] reductase